ncbi:acyl-CoA dehydrogenase family protein [Saccharopolyspora flava]|uniref:Acyl-CoA dehydrogenase n=1 Tax=Saccharopolyspora flava TaxID=95161 RepID=A0A1I6UFB2_9PSEU|nr:acyl-CoA dehydrogenase family protein [Saccharopolyspora flava]SFT00169.1 Acyl-CoA dehydrogenase [Saccharopolyspora flava]
MTHEVVQKVEALGPRFAAAAAETEKLGKLSAESVALVREAGVMRMLQPKDFGGFAAHPRDFAEAVMAVARHCGSTGWVCGVGGVHPWEMALCDRKVQEEVWGQDSQTWIASPYMPSGVAVPTKGGYVLNGRWQFSSGTDHCDWIFLGAMVGGADGKPVTPPNGLHVILPRADYTIVDDSWNVVGLAGTGSKDIIVENAFVPAYRTISASEVAEGETAAERAGRTETVYRLPFWSMFPLGITSAVVGITEGVLEHHLAYQRDRTMSTGTKIKEDPYSLYAISDAAAEIAASRAQLLDGITRLHDLAEAGKTITFEQRALVRRNQIRCAWRAVMAADQIFSRSGGNALRLDNPLQRFWRDAHAGLHHAIHTPGPTYHTAALTEMGIDPAPGQRVMI